MSSIVKRSIDHKTAEKAIAAAAAKAEELKLKISIAITDDDGELKAFRRMDGAPKLTVEIAQNKAYTSAAYGLATHVWFDFIKNDPPLLHGITHTPRLVVFGGGYPIKENGEVIGAIGISGGHYSQDMQCAQAALDAVGSTID
ncbi:GlcG/HbpS family heme-binding protein [Rhodoligotrophos ferricapiens]|uniref:GlcG/HbpS family heme-binding protein n=1 Tax=Rhodoligotrophos ferricapiens TaxID=3069264 RepID=UPI00315CA21A